MTRTITRRPTIRDLVALTKLGMPEDLYVEMTTGQPYEDMTWASGLDGSEYWPDIYSCDWLIRISEQPRRHAHAAQA